MGRSCWGMDRSTEPHRPPTPDPRPSTLDQVTCALVVGGMSWFFAGWLQVANADLGTSAAEMLVNIITKKPNFRAVQLGSYFEPGGPGM